MTFKVALINTYIGSGGASSVVENLFEASSKSEKFQLKIYSKKKEFKNILSLLINKILNYFAGKQRGVLWNNTNVLFADKLEDIEASDIIHMNWVADQYLNFDRIIKTNKPIIWTAHDLWPVSGG